MKKIGNGSSLMKIDIKSTVPQEDDYSPEIDKETWKRIQIAKAAYAYEVEDNPIVDDDTFDKMAKDINLKISTRRPDLDKFFKEHFKNYTGSWIWKHPDLEKIGCLVNAHRR